MAVLIARGRQFPNHAMCHGKGFARSSLDNATNCLAQKTLRRKAQTAGYQQLEMPGFHGAKLPVDSLEQGASIVMNESHSSIIES